MTGLLQLRLMILSASDSSPKQATWDNRPAKSFCRLHNVATRPKSQEESFRLLHIVQYIKEIHLENYINIAVFLVNSGEVSSHLPLPETSSILNNCQLLLNITLFPSAEDVAPSLIGRGQLATVINNRTKEQLPPK